MIVDIDTIYLKASKEFKVPEALIRKIEHVESKGNLKAYNRRTHDYCSMQINVKHVMKADLDAYKLLNDHSYCIMEGTRIFSWFYKRYRTDEAIKRYNCGTAKDCINNPSSIIYLKKVNRALKH